MSAPGKIWSSIARGMLIFVDVRAGCTHAIVGAETVEDVKSCIEKLEGIDSCAQRLIIGSRMLRKGRLGDYGVQPHVTLHLNTRLRGGIPWDRVLMCAQAFQLVWPKVRMQAPVLLGCTVDCLMR